MAENFSCPLIHGHNSINMPIKEIKIFERQQSHLATERNETVNEFKEFSFLPFVLVRY